jgi:hypothetical protein
MNHIESKFITVSINDKIGPINRWDLYEDPLNNFLQSKWIAEVTGGWTLQSKSWEIIHWDIEIEINTNKLRVFPSWESK